MSVRRHGRPAWTTLLLADEAAVMIGGQFRDVALPILMVALWPSPHSYALALLAGLVGRVALGGRFGRTVDGVRPRPVLVASYVLRAACVSVLAVDGSALWLAVSALLVLSVGQALYVPAMSSYQAAHGDEAGAFSLLGRLRMVSGLVQTALPLVAGTAIAAGGRGVGFAASAAAYAVSAILMRALPDRTPGRAPPGKVPLPAPRHPLGLPRPIRREVLVVACLNALGWAANALYADYLLGPLHAGAVRYGLALVLWGGAGLVSGWVLGRAGPARLWPLTGLALATMAASWAVMTRPVGYLPTALLGLPEGVVTWLLIDLLQVRTLDLSPPGERGSWTAAAPAWSAGGRVAGLAAVSVLPVFDRVHAGFAVLSVLIAVTAIYVCGLSRPRPVAAARCPPVFLRRSPAVRRMGAVRAIGPRAERSDTRRVRARAAGPRTGTGLLTWTMPAARGAIRRECVRRGHGSALPVRGVLRHGRGPLPHAGRHPRRLQPGWASCTIPVTGREGG